MARKARVSRTEQRRQAGALRAHRRGQRTQNVLVPSTATFKGKRVAVMRDPSSAAKTRVGVHRLGGRRSSGRLNVAVSKLVPSTPGQARRSQTTLHRIATKSVRGHRVGGTKAAQRMISHGEPTRARTRRRAILATRGRGKTGAHRFTPAMHPRAANGRFVRK